MRELPDDLARRGVLDEEAHEPHAVVRLPEVSRKEQRIAAPAGTAATTGSWITIDPRWAI